MDFSEVINGIASMAKVIDSSGHRESAEMVSYAVQKLTSANFCAEQISELHRGGVGDRAHAEATLFFCKAALDCAVDAVNRRFGLQLSQKGMAASSEDLDRGLLKAKSALNAQARSRLAQEIETTLTSDWYSYLKWLRDRITHRGVANYVFEVGGTGQTFLKDPEGSTRSIPVKDDLRQLLGHSAGPIYSWMDAML